MAAPHVAGVAALVHDLNPAWTPEQIIQQILDTAEPRPSLLGLVATGGRLSAAGAVGNPEPPPPPPEPVPLPVFDDFEDNQAQAFLPQVGNWNASTGRYTTTPTAEDPNLVSISMLNLADSLPSNVEVRTSMEADQGYVELFGLVLSNHLTNGVIVYDYVTPDDFKFAGADIDGARWILGHYDNNGWTVDVQLGESLQADVDYDLRLLIENDTDVTLFANGVQKLSHSHVTAITSGSLGLASKDSTSHFDNVLVQEYIAPAPATLPFDENFDDGLAQSVAPSIGVWYVDQGRYQAVPSLDQDAVGTVVLSDPLPNDLEFLATFNAADTTADRISNSFLVFDYQNPNDFKFAGAYVGADRWSIGKRTASGWQELTNVSEPIDALTDYSLKVTIHDDSTVTLAANGATKLSYTFTESIVDGSVGVATKNALAAFDDLEVRELLPPPPPQSTTLPFSEDFEDGFADHLAPQTDFWYVQNGRYRAEPLLDEDGISTVLISDPLPNDIQILTTFNADDSTAGRISNSFVIFDYQSPTDFKFAGAYVGADRWSIGERTATGWQELVNINESINDGTDYSMEVVIEDGATVTLSVNGATKLSHSFSESLVDGSVGVATKNAYAYFDDIQVNEIQPPPPPPGTTLPYSEDFEDGVADFFEVKSDFWYVDAGRYRVEPPLDEDGVSIVNFSTALPSDLEILATINGDIATSGRLSNGMVIFDYQSPTNFKFAGAYIGGNGWIIGHRDASGWVQDARLDESIDAATDYALRVVIENDSDVTLQVDGTTKVSMTFTDSVVDGDVGVGARNAFAYFDNVQIQAYVPPPPPPPVPSTTLPYSEDLSDGVADFMIIQSGSWSVELGRYRSEPLLDQDGISTINFSDPLPDDLEVLTTVNGDDAPSGRLSNAMVIFDYQSPTDFKFRRCLHRWKRLGHWPSRYQRLGCKTRDSTSQSVRGLTIHYRFKSQVHPPYRYW